MAHSTVSPRRKTNKSKRRNDGDHDGAVVSHKRSKTHLTDDVLASQHDEGSAPRRSNRSGAGSGGRTSQMEKIEAALESQVKKLRSATDLPEDALDNPIAPERRRKGGREKKQFNPPPPYVPPPTIIENSNPRLPSFHQRTTDSQRYGFHVPSQLSRVVPQSADTGLPQQPFGNPRFAPRQAPAATLDQVIDPVLLADRGLPQPTSRNDDGHSDDTSDESSAISTSAYSEKRRDGLASDGEEVDGWGRTNRRETIHPGFSQESREPERNAIRHASLPREPGFDHSRDEADEAALRDPRTSDDEQLHNATRGEVVDVLDRHHQTNRRPSAPDPDRLAVPGRNILNEVGPGPRAASDEPARRSRAPRNSKKSKDQPASPDTLAYYPAIWKDFLEEAKRDCRVVHALKNPFPAKSRDLKTSVTESLVTSVVEWTERGTTFEPGYWPDNKLDMAALLLADISTWRSELKTIALNNTPGMYGLVAPSNVQTQDRLEWVKSGAEQLLHESVFLRGGFDENGKTKNFAHIALKEAVFEFFYTGSHRIAHKRPDLFRRSVPIPCLALVAAAYNCVLDGFARNGSSKLMPHFSAKGYSSIYRGLLSIADQALQHPYHGPRLQDQLVQWGEEGWAALQQTDAQVERHNHLHVVLD